MKKLLLLTSSFFLLHCSTTKKQTTADIIAAGELSTIQTKKAEVVKSLNALQLELNQLNEAIQNIDTEQKFLLVTALDMKTVNYNHFVSFQGTLETDKNIVIYPELPGLLKKIHVKEGQKVNKGDLLASLTDSGLTDQLEQLNIQLKLAKTTYERQERLWQQKIGSEIQFLQAKTQYQSLKKSINQMEDQVAKSRVVASFDGKVDHLIADEGSNMLPGVTPILRLINLDQMKVTADIPEIHLPNIQANTNVSLTIPVIGEKRNAQIQSVGNFINPNNRSFRIEIALDNPKGTLKPNMTVKLEVNDYQNPTAILVPSKDILEDQAGKNYVFKLEVVDAQKEMYRAVKTFVKTGKSSNNQTEIIAGLSEGDQLVEEGIRLVKDQQLVKIIQP
jgi:RND family efflux transporter MFP subunit